MMDEMTIKSRAVDEEPDQLVPIKEVLYQDPAKLGRRWSYGDNTIEFTNDLLERHMIDELRQETNF
jgi:hypothetical protein